MIIAKAFFIFLATISNNDAFTNYLELSNHLETKVEWMDERGSSVISRSQALRKLQMITSGLSDDAFHLKHSSKWRSDQCFRIIHVKTESEEYRIFFQLNRKEKLDPVVTKIKLSKI